MKEKNQKQELPVTGEQVARKITKESCRRGKGLRNSTEQICLELERVRAEKKKIKQYQAMPCNRASGSLRKEVKCPTNCLERLQNFPS